MATRTDEEIKGEVREHYAEVPKNAVECCDNSGCEDASTLYTIHEIQELPSEAVLASAGCGNPTAVASLKPGNTVVDFGSGGGIDCFLAARAVRKLLPLDLPPWPRSLFDIDGDPLSESCRIGLRYEQRSRMPAPRHPRRRTILTSTAAPVLGELQSAGSA